MIIPDYQPGRDRFIPLEDLSYETGEPFKLHAAAFALRNEIRSRIEDVLHYPSPFDVRLERTWKFPDGATYNSPWFVFSFEREDAGVVDMRMFIDESGRNHPVIQTVQGVAMGKEKSDRLKADLCNPLEAMATHMIGSMTSRIRKGAEVYLLASNYKEARIEGVRDRFFHEKSEKIAPQGLLRLDGVRSFRGGGGYDAYVLNRNRIRVKQLLGFDSYHYD